MRLIQLLEQTSRRPRPARQPGNTPSERGYLYHATNLRHAKEIADTDQIEVFKPYFRDDRDTWPDGSDEERAYFHANVNSVKRFMPKGQNKVILRVPISAGNFQQEQETGYVYSNQPVDATRARILLNDGNWMFLRIFFKRWEKTRLAADYGGRPVGDPNAQQSTDDLPEFMTTGGQEANTGEKDVDYKPENIAAEGPLAPESDPTQARYDPELELGRTDQRQAGYNQGHPKP